MSSFVVYGAGKAALNQMTRNLAGELAPLVRVNGIIVGGIATQGLEVMFTNCEKPAIDVPAPSLRSS